MGFTAATSALISLSVLLSFFRYPALLSFLSFFCVLFLLLKFCFLCFCLMDHSGIRCTSPFVTFFFARLGVFIGGSSGLSPSVRDLSLGDSGLSLALGELYPLLNESLGWFELIREVLRGERMNSEGKSGNLGAILSSSAGLGEIETDTAISKPSYSCPSVPAFPRPFHALQEECSLKKDTFFRFRDRFQFPEGTKARLPKKGEKSFVFTHGEVCFYEVAFLCGLRFPVHPFIMELLHHLNITLG